MLMRHFSHGVGYLQYRTSMPQDSDSGSESGTMENADLVSDNNMSCDVEVDINLEEEGELEGDSELECDIDCDSEDKSEVSDNSSSNDLDGYASF
jgi:hypothetical protein